ncbi:MAG: TonB-dependent receptor plug domain-containing protein [Sphingomonas sp.]
MGGVSLLAVVAAAPAAAQQDPEAAAESSDGEIVVTATRREESILKVPLSITAYSQESLDQRGVRNIQDVVNQTPGVDLSRTGAASGQNRLIIRGIDSNAGAATSAIYIDDTPVQARNSSLNYNGSTLPYVFDVERVEVLRGPQGTLFGASSEGGAIRFITPTPSLSEGQLLWACRDQHGEGRRSRL